MNIRVGFGYDVHRLVKGRELILGGVKIDHHEGLDGHSDADVLTHVLCDALLGAACLRDIGYHFPDTDERYKGVKSTFLLQQVVALLEKEGFGIGNIDATICAERPKLNPHIEEIQKNLANCMQIGTQDVSIKATTTEKLGFTGREEGLSAYAVVLIYKK